MKTKRKVESCCLCLRNITDAQDTKTFREFIVCTIFFPYFRTEIFGFEFNNIILRFLGSNHTFIKNHL
jgi:hypothetical protein